MGRVRHPPLAGGGPIAPPRARPSILNSRTQRADWVRSVATTRPTAQVPGRAQAHTLTELVRWDSSPPSTPQQECQATGSSPWRRTTWCSLSHPHPGPGQMPFLQGRHRSRRGPWPAPTSTPHPAGRTRMKQPHPGLLFVLFQNLSLYSHP